MTTIEQARLTPDTKNANEGTQRGRGLLEKSLRKLGAGRSIVADKNGNVIAGNKTLEIAAQIDLPVRVVETDGHELVVVKRTDLDLYSEQDKRGRELAYADNKISEIDLAWKPEQIAVDFEPLELGEWGFELEDLEDDDSGNYSRKIEAPIYEPKGEKPQVNDLYDTTRTDELLQEIEATDLPEDEKEFLRIAARRHTVLNFKRIAEYYAHSPAPVQRLMENSALVIIDFNRAIELGYVKLSEEIAAQYAKDYPDAG